MSSPTEAAPGPSARLAPGEWLALAGQLALAVLVARRYELVSDGFGDLAVLTLGGFLVHALLPRRYRMAFFALLGMAGLFVVLDPADAAWVLGLGSFLVGICLVPIPLRARRVAVLVAGLALLAARVGTIRSPVSAVAWAVLGSMFMFRLIVFLYDRGHEKEPARLDRTLAYFFLLPNVCFPLFPVVDWRTFRTSYYDLAARLIHQRGMEWILRGITHLLLYRVVYYHLTLAPAEVATSGDLVRFLTSNLLLYLRVSGQFHLVVGLIRLFGFNLPETNHLYFLASSFNDYWRRINIYWKDFMLKVFYQPLFFALRKRGPLKALAVATAVVFLLSWLLHSYQWLWLQGDFPLQPMDGIFWGTVGLLVLANSLWEAKRGRRRSLKPREISLRELALRALRIVGVFTTICVLWSLWTSESVAEWLGMWRAAAAPGAGGPGPILLALAVLFVLALVGTGFERRFVAAMTGRSFGRSAATTAVALLAILALGTTPMQRLFGARAAGFLAGLTESRLNRLDVDRLERGYYEQLLEPGRRDPAPAANVPGEAAPAAEAVAQDTDVHELFHWTGDFLWVEIRPEVSGVYLGELFSSNRWGMRDRDYEKSPPARTRRLALIGSSHVMGHGVADDEVFDRRVEEGLEGWEILNFAVDDYSPLQQLVALETRALEFSPDVVVYVAHTADIVWVVRHLKRAVVAGVEIPYPYLREIVEEAGVDASMPPALVERRLRPYGNRVTEWMYRRFADSVREAGAVPVWIFLPKLKEHGRERLVPWLTRAAEQAGFRIVSLAGVYAVPDRRSLQVSPRDFHPNAEAHRLVAERLLAELRERPEILGSE